MIRFNVAGWTACGAFAQAKKVVTGMASLFPQRLSVDVLEHQSRDEYMNWLSSHRNSLGVPDHKTSPLVWTEDLSFIGGRDDTLKWFKTNMSQFLDAPAPQSTTPVGTNTDSVDPNHGFDYDLIVIGGGSGGLACSKEAKRLGAKVAVLDFVKPSPLGTTWGLGGTCVNVGCIPKKLMHNAALLGEHTHSAKEFGWEINEEPKHNWETLRDNVQDHIRSLNFGYRVQLREQGVTYINKLGSFVNENTLECVDKKGNKENITAARFVIAVGGRPSPLNIPGGEYAISSDDLFSLKEAPGKTCVIGAGYVALECAGFITGLKQGGATVLVRSVPLRGFDRDLVDKVVDYMILHGTNVIQGVTPTSIEKVPSTNGGKDQLRVHYSNGGSDVFDTVLCATGRYADTAKLNLDAVGVKVNPSNGKIIAQNEQTSKPHIYAIGDNVDKTPELTPVAIMAGRLLANRLFGASKNTSFEYMNYRNVPTTVFTPLEFGTVGYTEDQAIDEFGADAVDAYISSFTPLESTLLHLEGNPCFAKVVVNVHKNNQVLGIHIAAPNAGEIIQGFAVALKKGITYEELTSVVGIHPTVAEELVSMTVAKSSGTNAEKAGC